MAFYNLGTARGSIDIDTGSLKEADISLRNAGRGAALFGAAALAGFGYVIKTASDFEKEMDFVRVITQATADEMRDLEQAAIDLGKKGPFGPREVATSFVELAKAGIDTQDILNGVGEASVNLASAGDLGLDQASEILVNALRTFGLEAEDSVRVVDLIAGAANASTIEVEDFAFSLRYAGSVASAAGVGIEDVSTALAVLGDRGIKGSTAGTSLRRILLNLNPASEKAADVMRELGIITDETGNAFFDAEGNAKSLRDIFQILNDATDDLTQEQKIDKLNDIFGARAVASALILLDQGAEGWDNYVDAINRVSAAEVAEERLDNLAGAVTKLKAAIEAVFIETGTPFQEFLTDLVNFARELVLWFGRLPPGLQSFLLGSVAVVGILSLLAGGFLLTIGNIVRAIRVFGELAQVLPLLASGLARLPGLIVGLGRAISLFFLSPAGLVVLAIAAIIAAFAYFYLKSEEFREFINAIPGAIVDAWESLVDWFEGPFVDAISGALEKVKGFFSDLKDGVVDVVTDPVGALGDIGDGISDFTQGFAQNAFSGGTEVSDGGLSGIGQFLGSGVSRGIEETGNALGFLQEQAGSLAGSAASGLFGFFGNLGSTIGGALEDALDAALSFASDLPGILAGAAEDAFNAVVDWLSQLPEQVGYWLGFAIGRLTRWGVLFVVGIVGIGVEVVQAVISWGTEMAVQLGIFLLQMLTQLATWGAQFIQSMIDLGLRILFEVANFMQQLPIIVAQFLFQMLTTIITSIPGFISAAGNLAGSILTAIASFLVNLPGMVYTFFTDTLFQIIGAIPDFISAAWDLGKGVFDGVIGGIGDLVGAVLGIFESAIDAVKGVFGRAVDAGRSFGRGLWEGFKDGAGISSPSYIERALFAMDDTARETIASLNQSVGLINNQASRLPSLNDGTNILASTGAFAGSGAPGTQSIIYEMNQNAPLIGQATIRNEEDIEKLARRLHTLRETKARSRGVKIRDSY